MEIERKYLIKELPVNLDSYSFHIIEQGYLCTSPVVRIRRQDDDYILTYKGKGMMVREEYNLALTAESYAHLKPKADGNIITKKRYVIPIEKNLKIELDIFSSPFAPMMLAEVEFSTEEEALEFTAPEWFGEEVTFDSRFHNSYLSQMKF